MNDNSGCEKPPRKREEALEAAEKLSEQCRTTVLQILNGSDDAFWKMKRKEQIAKLLKSVEGTGTTQKDVANVMGVSEKTVSKTKYQLQKDGNVTPKGGRPSTMADVFPRVCDFIKKELEAGRSVTLGILVEYIAKKLDKYIERRVVREYMKAHGFSFVTGEPTEDMRVNADQEKLRGFYTSELPSAVEGVHPSLIFNMDEMGCERYADRKRIKVFIPNGVAHRNGMAVGVPRTSHRCTLMACISLDGSRLTPAIITKHKTVSSQIFTNGYNKQNLKLFTTKNSFVTGEVFGRWLTEIFIPHVEEVRNGFRQRLEHFNERAVLILDGCTSHKMERFQTLLESKNITMLFLVPHSSHLTQPLDLGVFGKLKNIMRDEASYSMNIKEMQTPNDKDEVRENEPAHVRNKRGKQLADYIEAILDAFERATTRRLVVSAFAQAGILFDIDDNHDPDRLKAYVDPSKARALNAYTGMFSGEASRDRTPGFQIWISTLAPNGDSTMPATVTARQQRGDVQADTPTGQRSLMSQAHAQGWHCSPAAWGRPV